MEHWKAVPGYDGLYEVSDAGRVRRITHTTLKGERVKRDYVRVTLFDAAHRRKRFAVHRLVALAFIGQCPPSFVVNHRDGNPANNRADNLEYTTQRYNVIDGFNRGRRPAHRGEATHFAKLSDADVIQIRRLRSEGHKYTDIAARFDTKPANVWHICKGLTWKHLLHTPPVPD